jgi:CRP-like cAMP-binding protein
MSDFTTVLKSVSIFADLDSAALAELEPLLVAKKFARDSLIVSQEEPGDAMFIVRSGRVKVVLYGDTGREIILSLLKSGDFFGEMSLLDDQPRSANVIALEESEVLVLHRHAFKRYLIAHPDVAFALLAELSRRLRRADEIIGNLALLDVFGRVAHMLIDLAQTEGVQTDEGILIKERPTQQNIASMVGTSRETVSRTLSEFAKRGYIEMQGRAILIKQMSVLESDVRKAE